LLLLTFVFFGFPKRLLANSVVPVLGYFAICAAMGIAELTLFARVTGAGGTASTVDRVISTSVDVCSLF